MREDSQDVKEMYDKFMGSSGNVNETPAEGKHSRMYGGSHGTSSILRYDDEGISKGQETEAVTTLIHNPTIN